MLQMIKSTLNRAVQPQVIVDVKPEVNNRVLFACLMRASQLLKELSRMSDKELGYMNPASMKLYRAAEYINKQADAIISEDN